MSKHIEHFQYIHAKISALQCLKQSLSLTERFHTGLGDEVEADRETVEQLVDKLKDEIKHVNAFVILFNGQVLATNKYVDCNPSCRVRGSPMG